MEAMQAKMIRGSSGGMVSNDIKKKTRFMRAQGRKEFWYLEKDENPQKFKGTHGGRN